MTVESATSNDAKIVDRLARLVAASSTFQSIVGAANATEALESIHQHNIDETETLLPWPRAVVHLMPDDEINIVGTAGSSTRKVNLGLTLEMEVPADRAESWKSQYLWILNRLGLIKEEMKALFGRGESVAGETHLNVVRMTTADGPGRYPQEECHYADDDAARLPRWAADYLLEVFT